MKYVIVEGIEFNKPYSRIELHRDDGLITGIPIDQENVDYQQYLAWLSGQEKIS